MDVTVDVKILSTDAFFLSFFQDERFQVGFKGGKTWSIAQRFREGIQGHWSYVREVRFPCLLSLMRGTALRPASAELREREG